MPGQNVASSSLFEFISNVQVSLLEMIAALTNRVIILTSRVVTLETTVTSLSGRTSIASSINNYSAYGDVSNHANLELRDLITTTSLGSKILSNLEVGNIVVVNVYCQAGTGGIDVDLTLTLRSDDDALISTAITIPVSSSGPLNITFVMSMRATTAFIASTVVYRSNIVTASAEPAFDRTLNHSLSVTCDWSDSESGGSLFSRSSTIETKFINK